MDTVKILLEFDSKEHMRKWMKSNGYSNNQIKAVFDWLGDFENRPEPTAVGLELWSKANGCYNCEVIDSINQFLKHKISFSDLKEVLDKYK